MYETLNLPVDPRAASALFGLLLGAAFGVMAQISRFCLRRAVAGDAGERRPALGVWLCGLAMAILATQGAVAAGWIDFTGHRLTSETLPVAALVLGGLLFGAGMVLTRGCVSRLTVLAGGGNLRAALVLVVFAVTAHAMLKGVLAPLRTAIGGIGVDLDGVSTLAALPGGAPVWTALLAGAGLAVALRSGARARDLALGGAIGLLAAAGWVGTGFVLQDDFDPIAFETLAFTLPWAEGLFYTIAATAVTASFGPGLVAGVVLGAGVSALIRGEFHLRSFDNPGQTGRYLAGAAAMGVGGVLAGGCTVGAGLSGVPTLSVAALVALAFIVIGGVITRALLADRGGIGIVPAE